MGRNWFWVGAIGVLALMVAPGCGGGMAPPGPAHQAAPAAFAKTWIAPDAGKSKQILFVSDYNNSTVEMFSVPGLKLKGVIAGFYFPEGLCSDAQGHVWVANSPKGTLIELSHTGKVLRKLDFLDGVPGGCAVDPRNGDLAVTASIPTSAYSGVEVYKHASGSPTFTGCLPIFAFLFAGYDNHDKLYVDGPSYSSTSALCSGKDTDVTLKVVRIRGTVFRYAGMVQWYDAGKYLALGDQSCAGSNTSCIYHVAISRNTGTVIGSTKLLENDGKPACDVAQAVIAPSGGTILGGVTACGSQNAIVGRWRYPAGGKPIDSYANPSVVSLPYGSALSVKP